MLQSTSRRTSQFVFIVFVLCCTLLATAYVVWATQRSSAVESPFAPPPTPPVQSPAALQGRPHLISINLAGPGTNDHVQISDLQNLTTNWALTPLQCFRVHYAGRNGLCLQYNFSTELESSGRVMVFGADFQPRASFSFVGYPSRARVSSDGRYAAYTIFTTGHSYNEVGMSTETDIIEIERILGVGDLEDFALWQNGVQIRPVDANFWGVTFAPDSNRFYATLKYAATVYLVQGDIQARTVTVLRPGVECPSVSPDGTHLAFKKATGSGGWRLAVLELATMQETLLSETESVDDQVEWLDDEYILYQRSDPSPPPWLSIMKVRADGTGQPEVFLAGAASPAVVR